MTVQEQMLADAKRNRSIENFAAEPAAPAQPRAVGPGAREFSFGGQNVYTWSADQEKRDRAASATVDTQKSFAELLTTELPSRMAVAKRLWSEGGDRASAETELASIDTFVRDNRDTLRTLAQYSGSNRLAKTVSDQAAGFLAGAHRADFATMDRDPEIKAKVAAKRARDMGLGAAAETLFAAADSGDPEAIAARDMIDAAPVPAGTTGRGASPEAARAAAHGIDPDSATSWSRFVTASKPAVFAGLPQETLDALGPAGKVGLQKSLFDSYGESAGTAFGSLANQAAIPARDLGPVAQADAVRLRVNSLTRVKQETGAMPGTVESGVADKIVRGLHDIQPDLFDQRAAQYGATAKKTMQEVNTAMGLGTTLSPTTASKLAKVIYYRNFRPTDAMPAELQPIAEARLASESMQSRIMASASVSAPKEEAALAEAGAAAATPAGQRPLPPKPGTSAAFDPMASRAKQMVQRASAMTMENGRPLNENLMSLAPDFAEAWRATGVQDPQSADALAKLTLGMVADGQSIDFSLLPDQLKRLAIVSDNGKPDAALAAPKSERDRAVAKLLALGASRAPATPPPAAVPGAAPAAASTTAAELDPEVLVLKSVLDIVPSKASPLDPAGITGAFAAIGNVGKLITPVATALGPVVDKVLGAESRAVSFLTNDIPISALLNDADIDRATDLAMADYSTRVPLVAKASDQKQLRDAVRARVQATAKTIWEDLYPTARTAADRGGATTAATQLGGDRAALADLIKRDPGNDPRLVSGDLASAFLGRKAPGVSTAGAINNAKNKVLELVKDLPEPAAPTVAPRGAELSSVSSFDVPPPVAAKAMKDLESWHRLTSMPVTNPETARIIDAEIPELFKKLFTPPELMGIQASAKAASHGGASPDAIRNSARALADVRAKELAKLEAEKEARKELGD